MIYVSTTLQMIEQSYLDLSFRLKITSTIPECSFQEISTLSLMPYSADKAILKEYDL